MNIRRYHAGEEEEIWRLRYRTTREIIGKDYTKAQVERWAPDQMDADWKERLERKNPFVADQAKEIIGFAELEADGHVDGFYCHADWQRKGVGKRLLAAIEEEARRTGLSFLFLESSTTARGFFSGQGFEVVSEEENVICGAPARRFHMRKRLI